jgi:hypothetical protein
MDLDGVRYGDIRDTAVCGGREEDGHSRLHTMTWCEARVRSLERGGGVGQWLLAVKDDHRRQLAGAADGLTPAGIRSPGEREQRRRLA